jgi:photosystem II stability/assembly factor-like uncharacterized protein
VDTGSWTIDTLPADYGLGGVCVDADGGAIVVGSFAMLRRVARGPWERVTLRGQLQLGAVAGAGSTRIAVGYPHRCVVSNDGGAKWHNRKVGGKRTLDTLVCMSEKQIFIAGEDGAYVTNDAGKTFSRTGDMRYLALVESGLYGASGNWKQSVLHHWRDGEWHEVGPMPHSSSGLVGAADVLVSIGGNVCRSVDGGKTWTETLPEREEVYLVAVAAHMTGRVVVVGYAGLILVSEDYGVTWVEHHPTDHNLRGVCIAPDEDIWAVGDGGVLVRSGTDRADAVTAQTIELADDDGIEVDRILRAASPAPVWTPAEKIGAAIHSAAVTAATFLDDTHAVTGDLDGRLVHLARGTDGRWRCEARELGGAITGLAAIGDAVFAIVDGKLRVVGGESIKTTGKVSRIAARANRLAVSGPKHVTTWQITDGKRGKASTIGVRGEPTDLDISVDGAQIAYVIGDRVFTRNAASGKAVGEFRRKGNPHVRFTPAGTQFYVAADRSGIALLSVAKGGGRESIRAGRAWKIATSPRGTYAVTLAYTDEVTAIDTATGALVSGWHATEEVTVCGARRTVANEGRLGSLVPLDDLANTAVAVSDAGGIVVGGIGGEVAIIDTRSLELQHAQKPRAARLRPPLEQPLIDVATLAYGRDVDTRRVLVLGADHRVRVIDPDSGEVRAGPRVNLANVDCIDAVGDVIVVATSDGWVGLDRRSGAQRWRASFPVRGLCWYRGALYGVEPRRSYAEARPLRRVYKLDAKTGDVAEVPLDERGACDVTRTAAGLVVAFGDDDDRRTMLIDSAGAAIDTPHNVRAQLVDPSDRYLMSSEGVIYDTSDPAWPIVARDVPRSADLLLYAAGVVVSIDQNDPHMHFHDLRGTLVASIGGVDASGGTEMFATSRAEAIVTCSRFGPVRRWPVVRAGRR